ncbi:MAG TPA: hypothetical protein ENN25_07380 [Euryarchaeota archaeon]|nr:hypothetical protein [Euryarchaeota archaeon]
MSISLGSTSEVEFEKSDDLDISIEVDGESGDYPVTFDAIKYLISNQKCKVAVRTTSDLPVGQGFGMSASGALSAAIALCEIMDIPRQKAFEACHVAEVRNGTGLGDVAGIFAGGFEVRREPGLPPKGAVEALDIGAELVLGVIGDPISTSEFLTDRKHREKISAAGKVCMEAFYEDPTLDCMFALGLEFVEEAELFSIEVLRAVAAADQYGMASMVMLGNAVFSAGDIEKIEDALSPFGPTFRCAIDRKGPRIVP